MHKFISSLLLIAYLPGLYANSQDQNISAQTKQDLELLQSFNQFSKQSSGGNIIFVGGGIVGCAFSSIQDAIDSIPFSGNAEIRIATDKTYTENLVIDDQHIELIGGYEDCRSAGLPNSQPGNTKVIVDGNNASLPTLRIGGNILRNTVVIKNIQLKNGSTSAALLGGGLTAFDADTEVLLTNVSISNNSGSGLAILGTVSGTSDTDIVMLETIISSNTANFAGGGIYCADNDASIIMGSDSGLIFNQVTADNGRGGGAFISAGCSFSMYSAGMVSNTSKDDGGGLFVGNGAQVNIIGRQVCNGNVCLGDDIRPVRFNANHGDFDTSGQGNGGAIYITDASTLVDMSQVWIDDNTAFHGGAISVHNGAALSIDRFSKNCWNSSIDDKCNLFEANLASNSSGNGGAIYNNNSQILVNKTYLENNRADFGTAIYTIGLSAVSVVDGSVFNHNGNDGLGGYSDRYVVRATGGSTNLIIHSTFADNHATESVFGISSIGNSSLITKKSIVHDSSTGDVLNGNSGTTSFDCILAHEINSITGSQLFFGDPQFLDRNNGNYHIEAAISPAVDLCIDTAAENDIDTDIRGWDDPTVPNQGNNADATYDAGADETYANDIIFIDGFE